MSFDQIEWVWMNGRTVRRSDARVSILTHTLHLGSGVFEAMRCYKTDRGPAVFRLDSHLHRLYASAAIYRMEIPYAFEELASATCQLIRLNDLSSCYVRVLAYFGSGGLGVFPVDCPVQLAILSWPLGTYLGANVLESGVRVTVSSWVKFHSRMMPTTAKACGQYLNSLLALREATSKGYDEAILLDADGNVAEGSAENIFLVRDGRLFTNDETSSILMGITRDTVITIARELGLRVEITKLSLNDLMSADEAFFTGTAAEITPIREVDGKTIGTGRRGVLTTKIQKYFFAVTAGREPKHTHWLRYVDHGFTLQKGTNHASRSNPEPLYRG